jgi:dihydropyrimidinase
MRSDYNVYEGMTVKGKPIKVYLRGRLIVDGDAYYAKNGDGQYIPRQPHAPVL